MLLHRLEHTPGNRAALWLRTVDPGNDLQARPPSRPPLSARSPPSHGEIRINPKCPMTRRTYQNQIPTQPGPHASKADRSALTTPLGALLPSGLSEWLSRPVTSGAPSADKFPITKFPCEARPAKR